MSDKRLEKIMVGLRQFAEDRDWDQFHSPKNLSMALIAEAAELVEHFQWLTEDQSNNLNQKQLEEVAMEMADVQIYLLRLAEKLQLDMLTAVEKKMAINAEKYPAEIVKGSSKKYTEYK
ncbi:MAG: nucleotide pyrophosphohydrolase [Sideroxydans sp.]